MRLLYIDESGDPNKDVERPVFGMLGVAVRVSDIKALQLRYDKLKSTFFPKQFKANSHTVLKLLKSPTKGDRDRARKILSAQELKTILMPKKQDRRSLRFIFETIKLCKSFDIKVIPIIIVKKDLVKKPDHSWIYPLCVQRLVSNFHRYLEKLKESGMLILDSRQELTDDTLALEHLQYMRYNTFGQNCTRVIDIPYFT